LWFWIAYQTIKGLATQPFIRLPLVYLFPAE
jgi:hypothetical protein